MPRAYDLLHRLAHYLDEVIVRRTVCVDAC